MSKHIDVKVPAPSVVLGQLATENRSDDRTNHDGPFGMKQQCPWGCMKPRGRESAAPDRWAGSIDPPKGLEEPRPFVAQTAATADRPRCKARIETGLAHRGTAGDCFGWHHQRLVPCAGCVPAIRRASDVVVTRMPSTRPIGGFRISWSRSFNPRAHGQWRPIVSRRATRRGDRPTRGGGALSAPRLLGSMARH
jgi:hypothetical protein